MVICCMLLLQGYFNQINDKSTIEMVNAAINYFREIRGDGVENADQVRFIYQFLLSAKSMGSSLLLKSEMSIQPTIFLSDIIFYNFPASEDCRVSPVLTVFIKQNNSHDIIFNSQWTTSLRSFSSVHWSFTIPVPKLFRSSSLVDKLLRCGRPIICAIRQ